MASQVAQYETPRPVNFSSPSNPALRCLAPKAQIKAFERTYPLSVCIKNCPSGIFDTIAISINLSGSYEAANVARNIVLDEYAREHDGVVAGKNIYVLNSRAAGGKLEVIVKLLYRYLTNNNPTFGEAVAYVENIEEHSQVLYSLSSYENLMKNGRMPRIAGMIASKLNIRVLGTASPEGTIKIVGPARGEKKMAKKIVSVMEADGYSGGMVYIDHVENEPAAKQLEESIHERWPEADVSILPCGALCSYYAEQNGLIIGYTWAQI